MEGARPTHALSPLPPLHLIHYCITGTKAKVTLKTAVYRCASTCDMSKAPGTSGHGKTGAYQILEFEERNISNVEAGR
jgi:hypothetical protein